MRRQPWSKKNESQRSAGKRSRSTLKLESLETRHMLAADLLSMTPADNATGVDPNANLVLTFSSDVKPGPGAGRLLIMNATDGSLVEAVDVSDPARVSFSGATVTVDPVKALPSDAKLYVTLDPGAIRDTSTSKADGVLFSENFETTKLINSELDHSFGDNYGVVLTGTLDVQTAGDYRFGSRSDDGSYLAIDLNGDGVVETADGSEDTILWNEGNGENYAFNPVTLAKGQYKFEYGYREGGGSAYAEVFYAVDDGSLGDPIAFNADKFAIIGDASKGIGVTVDGIKATTYQGIEGQAVGDLQTVLDLRDGNLDLKEGFPVVATIKTADIWDSGSRGYFGENNRVPGTPPDASTSNYYPDMPAGWSKDTNLPQPEPVYNGWTQLNKDFWLAEQGGQARELWTHGAGTVAVMDPDAFDDYSSINSFDPPHNLQAFTTLPPIDLTDVTANTVTLNFDSSFRPESVGNTNEDHPDWIGQTALIDVSFDNGATWTNVLVKNSETDGPDGSQDHVDEQLSVDIANPTGGAMLVRFGIVNSQNNWWWAVDNIVLKGEAVGALNAGIVGSVETWNFSTKSGTQPLQGDFNGDGKVDLTDFGILKTNFGTGTTTAQGDANGDAKVDLTDFGILKTNFGKSAAAPAPAVVAQATDYLFAVGVAQAAKSTTESDFDPFSDDTL